MFIKQVEDKLSKMSEAKKVSVLASSWEQIHELLKRLSYERYIDDQFPMSVHTETCVLLSRRDID